jgi:hypothetical protein
VADRAYWQAQADALDEAHARGRIDDAQWFAEMAAIFEAAYLAGDNPRAQSGFGGDEACLPQWPDRLVVGNALTWSPPRRFGFVRTELVYVPADRRRQLVERLLEEVVAPAGRLIVCGYGCPRSGVLPDPVCATVRSWGFEPELEPCAPAPEGGPIVEVAALGA